MIRLWHSLLKYSDTYKQKTNTQKTNSFNYQLGDLEAQIMLL